MNSLERFCNRATDYAKYRPSYPATAIDRILEGLNNPLVAADIGAGTGIFSRLLAERGVRVLAIEPNADMRQAAAPHPLVEFFDSTAEKTGIAKASIDLVTCFQSFHWFDRQPTVAEFRRILKPGGRLALVWNQDDASDKFTVDCTRLIFRLSFPNPLDRLVKKVILLPSKLVQSWYDWQLFRLLRSYNFASIRSYEFAYKQELDLSGLIGLARSQSFVPLSESVQQRLVSGLGKLCDRYGDENSKVSLVYKTIVYIAQASERLQKE